MRGRADEGVGKGGWFQRNERTQFGIDEQSGRAKKTSEVSEVVRTAALTKTGKPSSWGCFREETEAGFRQAEEGRDREYTQTGPAVRKGGRNVA